MLRADIFDAIIAILIALVVGAVGTALTRIWHLIWKLQEIVVLHGNRLIRMETCMGIDNDKNPVAK